MKAWIVTIDNIDAVVFAPTRGKASWIAVRSYREAGYGTRNEWPSVRVARAKRYDVSRCQNNPDRCWDEHYVSGTI